MRELSKNLSSNKGIKKNITFSKQLREESVTVKLKNIRKSLTHKDKVWAAEEAAAEESSISAEGGSARVAFKPELNLLH